MDFIGRLPRLKNFGQMSTQTIPKPKKKKSHKKLIVLIIIILIFIIRQARTPGTIIANIIKKITGK